jgi:hypothetical protein
MAWVAQYSLKVLVEYFKGESMTAIGHDVDGRAVVVAMVVWYSPSRFTGKLVGERELDKLEERSEQS